MRILVTGGSGLVGSHVVSLLSEAHDIVAPTRSELDLAGPWDPGALPDSIDAVVHTAQARNFRDFPAKADEIAAINLSSTQHLLEYARTAGARHFVYTSTGGVYAPSEQLLTESSPLKRPEECDFYAATKLASEQLVSAYRNQFATVILRLFTVYGPGQDPNMLIPRLERSIAEGTSIQAQGDGGIRLRPTHAIDVARAIQASLELTGATILDVAGPEVLSLRDICGRLAARMGTLPQFEESPGTGGVLAPTADKAAQILALESTQLVPFS